MNPRARLLAAAGLAGALVAGVTLGRTPRTDTGSIFGRANAIPSARVTLAADGTMTLSRAGTSPRTVGNLIAGTAATQRAALEGLREQLREALRSRAAAETTDDVGSGAVVLEVELDPELPWDRALWVLEVVSAPPSSLQQVGLVLLGDPRPPIPQQLEYGRGLALVFVGQRVVPVMQIQLGVDPQDIDGIEPPARRVSVSWSSLALDEAAPDDFLVWRTGRCTEADVRKLAAAVREVEPTLEAGILDVQRPLRSRMHSGDVLTVLRGLRDAGIAPVWILNRTMTLPGDR